MPRWVHQGWSLADARVAACGLGVVICVIAGQAAAVPIVVAHRGHSSVAPENTVAAINAAAGFADWVEFDVRETMDGELVLMHDFRQFPAGSKRKRGCRD